MVIFIIFKVCIAKIRHYCQGGKAQEYDTCLSTVCKTRTIWGL